jgi:hypothetical protein
MDKIEQRRKNLRAAIDAANKELGLNQTHLSVSTLI